MLTSLFSFFYVTGEFHRFLHQGRARSLGSPNKLFRLKDLRNVYGITMFSSKSLSLGSMLSLVSTTGQLKFIRLVITS